VPALVIVLSAVATGLAAIVLTRWMQRIAGTESRWLRSGLHVLLASGAGAGAAALATGWAELAGYAILSLGCALLFVIDLAALRLPDRIIGPLYLAIFAALAAAALGAGQPGRLGRAALAAAILLAVYFVLALISPSGLGLGDVKLAGVLGAFLGWLGWSQALAGTLAAFLLSGAVAIILLIATRANRRTAFPFGPLMIAGAAVGAGIGPAIAAF
jgi:leader peptidase (prepilin peptidase) / N-methyltransferase